MWLKEFVRPYYLRWIYFKLFPQRHPEHFRSCWRFPDVGPSTQSEFLFLPMTDWHTRTQRTQHLARAIATRGRQCLIVNPHLGRQFPHPYVFSRTPRLLQLEKGIAELHVHLPLEPVFHHRQLTSRETDAVCRAIRSVGGDRKRVQIVSFPVWGNVARQLRKEFGYPIIYDCNDWLAGFRGVAPTFIEEEERLIAEADLVLFSASSLQERHRAQKSLVLRNAVWGRPEAQLQTKPTSRVVIGYVGALDFWFDREAVAFAARRHPEWEFRLVGRIEDPSLEQLRSLGNVQFTGEVPHEALDGHMSEFSAGIIPFTINELTLGTNPIKLYEYYSYGLPVVSTRLPEIEEFNGGTYLADTPDEFTSQLEKAVAGDSAELRQRRQAMVRNETWEVRADALLAAVDSLPSPVGG